MLPNMKPQSNVKLFLGNPRVRALESQKPRYSLEDWNFSNNYKLRTAHNQLKLKDKIEGPTRGVIAESNESTKDWQIEVAHNLRERITAIEFVTDELNKQSKTIAFDIEAMSVYRDRLERAIDFLKDKSLAICKQCLLWRENRLGIDLCEDQVDLELRQELVTTKGCQQLVDRLYRDAVDRIRGLKAALVIIDEDIVFKNRTLKIDNLNLRLKQEMPDLGLGKDLTQHICGFPLEVWQQQTFNNIENNAKEINLAQQTRSYIDLMLNQVCEDMRNKTERTNSEFRTFLTVIKHIKRKMEDQHREVMRSILEVRALLEQLQTEMDAKDRAMLLCRVRMSNRSERRGLELTCDEVHVSLSREMEALQVTVCKLKQKIAENKSLMRYLLHHQIVLEEEINIKANTIKIDEVDCLTLREALVYTSF